MLPATSTCWHSTARGPRPVGGCMGCALIWPLISSLIVFPIGEAAQMIARRTVKINSLAYRQRLATLLRSAQKLIASTARATYWAVCSKSGCRRLTTNLPDLDRSCRALRSSEAHHLSLGCAVCCVLFCVAAVIAAITVSLDAVRRYEARVRRLAKCLGVLPGMAVMGMMIPALLYITSAS